jgi:hypothetical protein
MSSNFIRINHELVYIDGACSPEAPLPKLYTDHFMPINLAEVATEYACWTYDGVRTEVAIFELDDGYFDSEEFLVVCVRDGVPRAMLTDCDSMEERMITFNLARKIAQKAFPHDENTDGIPEVRLPYSTKYRIVDEFSVDDSNKASYQFVVDETSSDGKILEFDDIKVAKSHTAKLNAVSRHNGLGMIKYTLVAVKLPKTI